MGIRDAVLWLPRQMAGALKNFWALFSDTGLNDLLPQSWVDTIIWIRDSFPRSLGFADNPQEQLINVVVFTVAMVVVSLATLTYIAIPYALLFIPVALLRFWPAVDDRWPVSPSSWPLWSVRETGAR